MDILRLFLCLTLSATTAPALAHEFWIDAAPYAFAPDSSVTAELRNGQSFSGIKLPYLPNNTARFELRHEGEIFSYAGRVGDFPAFQSDGFTTGLVSLVHETTPSTITYATWDKFADFVAEKGHPDILERHQLLGLSQEKITEYYTRHAKALIAVGDGAGEDAAFGMKTEFIALTNPYAPSFDGEMQVELRLDQAPQPETQVTVFEKSPEGDVATLYLMTDPAGHLRFGLRSGHHYLLDAVAIVRAPEGSNALWESYWAALTFAAPE